MTNLINKIYRYLFYFKYLLIECVIFVIANDHVYVNSHFTHTLHIVNLESFISFYSTIEMSLSILEKRKHLYHLFQPNKGW